VPANRLKDILAKHPNAVVLSREQYETLVRDATVDKKPAPEAPRRAALTEAKYHARLAGKVVQVTAALTVKMLADGWAEVPLDFGGASIGAVNVDGEAALMPERLPQAGKGAPAANAGTPTALLLRGRGERRITVEFTHPVSLETGLSRVRMKLPAAAASSFVFDLPANQRVESPQPISITKTPEMTSVTAALAEKYPKAVFKTVESVVKVTDGKEELDYYEVLLTTAEKKELEVQIFADGKVKATEEKKDEPKKDEKKDK